MPGRVVSLLVEAGDAVEAGQGIVVLEAMKMENEIKAPIDGTVSEIRVQEKQDVAVNDVLVVIEP